MTAQLDAVRAAIAAATTKPRPPQPLPAGVRVASPAAHRILAVLLARYPERLVPRGDPERIARELGCSRALVSIVATDHGFLPATRARRAER